MVSALAAPASRRWPGVGRPRLQARHRPASRGWGTAAPTGPSRRHRPRQARRRGHQARRCHRVAGRRCGGQPPFSGARPPARRSRPRRQSYPDRKLVGAGLTQMAVEGAERGSIVRLVFELQGAAVVVALGASSRTPHARAARRGPRFRGQKTSSPMCTGPPSPGGMVGPQNLRRHRSAAPRPIGPDSRCPDP